MHAPQNAADIADGYAAGILVNAGLVRFVRGSCGRMDGGGCVDGGGRVDGEGQGVLPGVLRA